MSTRPRDVAVPDFARYKLMQDFANRVGDVLATIADTLMPQDFENLVNYGFEEGPSGAA